MARRPAVVFAFGWVLLVAATWQSVGAASCLGPSWPRRNVSGGLPPVNLDRQNWNSHYLVTGVASILLEEALGQQVVFDTRGWLAGQPEVTQWSEGWFERLVNGSLSANLEVWTTAAPRQRSLNKFRCASNYVHGSAPLARCVHEQFHGYEGTSAQFYAAQPPGGSVPDFDYWRRFTDRNSAPMLALPPANFTANQTQYPRYLCPATSGCAADGRFYPTVCGGKNGTAETAAAAGCKAFFHGKSTWDTGLIEDVIEQHNLRLVVTYVGINPEYSTVLEAHMQEAYAAG
jgi:hypothetical protein|eukprot:COSAG01_NODE_3216_length_6403_cov_5.741751_2_plen_288_part_00